MTRENLKDYLAGLVSGVLLSFLLVQFVDWQARVDEQEASRIRTERMHQARIERAALRPCAGEILKARTACMAKHWEGGI